jgi:hypothetical protein
MDTCARKIGFVMHPIALEYGILAQVLQRLVYRTQDMRRPFERIVPMRCFILSCLFFSHRFLDSQAVLQKDILRTAWLESDAVENAAALFVGDTREHLLFALLRSVPFAVISLTDAARYMYSVFGMILNPRSSHWRGLTRQLIEVFHAGVEWGLGHLVHVEGESFPGFRRLHWSQLTVRARERVVEMRAQPWLFGALRSPQATTFPHERIIRFTAEMPLGGLQTDSMP